MTDSILTSTKNILGIEESYTVFDPGIIMHINSVFSTLNQLGLGPDEGFMIEDASPVWNDFFDGDLRLNSIKTYVYLRVRLLFDPPTTSYLIAALNEQVKELEWRLNVVREGDSWTNPLPGGIVPWPSAGPYDPPIDLIIDGGDLDEE